jgi:hypothetical protein
LPTAPASFGVSSRNVYRTEAGGTSFKKLTSINDNVTSSFVDTIADASLGVAAPTDQGVPPQYSAIVYHKDRLFVNDPQTPNAVWYSELSNPYVFKSTNFIVAGDNTSDLVRALAVFEDGILIMCDRSMYIVYMPSTTASDWMLIKAQSPYGCKSRFGAFNYQGRIMFPAIQQNKLVGFAALAGSVIEPDATFTTISTIADELKTQKISPDIYSINEAALDKITSFVFRDKAYISIPHGTTQTTNNRIFVWDFSLGDLRKTQKGAWIPWTGINAEQFCEYDGGLYAQSSDTVGHVLKLNNDTYNDNSVAIDSYYWTKEFSGTGGDENYHKDFRAVNVLYEKAGSYDMQMRVRVDSDIGVGTPFNIDLNPGGSLWGSMVWGRNNWGGGSASGDTRIYLGNTRGKRVQFGFSNHNDVNQKFKIIGLKFTYNNKGIR